MGWLKRVTVEAERKLFMAVLHFYSFSCLKSSHAIPRIIFVYDNLNSTEHECISVGRENGVVARCYSGGYHALCWLCNLIYVHLC